MLGVVPSAHARNVYLAILPHLKDGAVIVSATKGIEHDSLLRMSEVIANVFASRTDIRTAVLSGPSFAREVARGDPTAVVVASREVALASELQENLPALWFRPLHQ